MIAAVVVNSFGDPLVQYLAAGRLHHALVLRRPGTNSSSHDVLIVTFEVVGAVVLLSGLLGVPAAYALARRNFPGKQLVILLFLLPMLIPPITFGIPLATVLYQAHLGGNMSGRHPRQSGADRAVRRAGDDPVHRADRPAHRGGGARVRRRHRRACSSTCWCRCSRPASSRRCCWCWCAPSRCSS